MATNGVTTLGGRFDDAGGRPAGFDYMRLALAVSVVAFHSFQYCYVGGIELAWHSWARGFLKFLVPMFFCLSGFLVAGSFQRSNTLIKFLGLRFIRIYPALSVEVLLSAFLIGPIVTTYPLAKYVVDGDFIRYLFNVTGDISYVLPGVFAHNPYPSVVNAQLWTVKYELLCYIALSVLFVLSKRWLKWSLVVAIALVSGAVLLYNAINHRLVTDEVESGPYLILFFLAGVWLYVNRSAVPHKNYIFVICLLSAFILMGYVPGGDMIGVYPLSYVTIYLGVQNPPRIWIIKAADISYGVYLYGAVIQQTLVYAFPWSRHWYWNIALTLPACLFIAWCSWTFVEKPIMGLRHQLDQLEAWAIESWNVRVLRKSVPAESG